MYEAQQELELSNDKHAVMVEKYKKDLNDMKDQHTEEKLKLQQLLEDTKEEYSKQLENVR